MQGTSLPGHCPHDHSGSPSVASVVGTAWACHTTLGGDRGRVETAAGGGAGRISPPREASPKVYGRQFRCSGCHRLIHPNLLVLLSSRLPVEMEPEEGFEPSTFRLRVEEPWSSRCQPGRSWLLRSVGSSSQCVPDLPSYGRWNDCETALGSVMIRAAIGGGGRDPWND